MTDRMTFVQAVAAERVTSRDLDLMDGIIRILHEFATAEYLHFEESGPTPDVTEFAWRLVTLVRGESGTDSGD